MESAVETVAEDLIERGAEFDCADVASIAGTIGNGKVIDCARKSRAALIKGLGRRGCSARAIGNFMKASRQTIRFPNSQEPEVRVLLKSNDRAIPCRMLHLPLRLWRYVRIAFDINGSLARDDGDEESAICK